MTDQNITIISNYLSTVKQRAVSLIVNQAKFELIDYRNRDMAEFTRVVEASYLNWYETIARNDFSYTQLYNEKVIKEGVANGRDPVQIASTPRIICEIALKLLDETFDEEVTRAVVKTDFIARANHLTTQMITMGHLSLVRAILDNAMKIASDI